MPPIKDPFARAKAPAALAVAALLLVLLALVALVDVVLVRAPARPAQSGSRGAATTVRAVAAGTRAELVARLRDIVQVREQAFARRDATLLETVYTRDCPCLRAGRAAIAGLVADRAVWRERSVSVEVEGLSRVNAGLWIVIAVFSSRAFRIEREDGTLLRAAPAERQRYRFALARPGGRGDWMLGRASLLEDLGA